VVVLLLFGCITSTVKKPRLQVIRKPHLLVNASRKRGYPAIAKYQERNIIHENQTEEKNLILSIG